MLVGEKIVLFAASIAGLVVAASSCSSSDEDPGPSNTGGFMSTGGLTSTGGTTATGGMAATGGVITANGGVTGTGGVVATGGSGAGGGPEGSGGTPGSGGMPGSGGSVATGGTVGATGGSPGTGGTSTGSLCLKPSGDFTKKGPYAIARKTVDLKDSGTLSASAASPTTATIFHPNPLEATCKHPVVAWGNGTTVTGPDTYAFFNENAASWGIVVIAADNSNAASANFLPAGLDYMMKENANSASPFFQKLSGKNGTAGHSQGAIAATTATSHATVSAEVQVQGGGRPKAGIAFLALTGTADNIVGTQSPTSSYTGATGPSMLANYQGADHISTPTLAGAISGNAGTIQYMRFYTGWFRCFLADDPAACTMFKGGANCGVCKDPNWATLQTKGM